MFCEVTVVVALNYAMLTTTSQSRFKSARKQVNEATKLAKTSYYNTYFAANQGNIKNSWKGINLIMAKAQETTKNWKCFLHFPPKIK